MNLIKSIYIIIYISTVLVGVSFFAFYQLWSSTLTVDWIIAWTGTALTSVPFMLRLSAMMLFGHEARTSQRMPVLIGLALTGAIMAAVSGNLLALGLSGYGLMGLLLYIFWYTELSRPDNKALVKGQVLPAFDAQDINGNNINSQSLLGKSNLILFYRGNWCPLCMAQIKEVAQLYRQLDQADINIVLISPQSHRHTTGLAAKFDVPFQFWVDKDNRAAKALQIDMQNGLPMGMQVLGYDSDTVYPTVIITNPSGQILYIDQTDNYRVRPEPQTFIDIFKQHQLISFD